MKRIIIVCGIMLSLFFVVVSLCTVYASPKSELENLIENNAKALSGNENTKYYCFRVGYEDYCGCKKIKNQNGIRVEGVVEDSQDDGSGN